MHSLSCGIISSECFFPVCMLNVAMASAERLTRECTVSKVCIWRLKIRKKNWTATQSKKCNWKMRVKEKKTNKETNCNPVYILQIYILQILRKYDMNTLQIYPPHLSDVATLPWEIQKVIFHHYYLYTPNYLLYLEENKL